MNATAERTVLVVDDDPSIRNLLSAVLRRRGLEVDVASNGEEALDALRLHSHRIVLLDLMMPHVNGQGFLTLLTSWPAERRPLILVVTASDEADLRELDRSLVAGIIRKPFDIFEVAELVRACAERPQGESSPIIDLAASSSRRRSIPILRPPDDPAKRS
jgi:two-component system, OmpR family, response regulator